VSWELRRETVEIDGQAVQARELTAAEAADLWPTLSAAEASGSMIDAFKAVVAVACELDNGQPVFAKPDEAPIRVLGQLAGKVLEMSDLGVDRGNSNGALGDDLPIS
jgi:hypothetical protein